MSVKYCQFQIHPNSFDCLALRTHMNPEPPVTSRVRLNSIMVLTGSVCQTHINYTHTCARAQCLDKSYTKSEPLSSAFHSCCVYVCDSLHPFTIVLTRLKWVEHVGTCRRVLMLSLVDLLPDSDIRCLIELTSNHSYLIASPTRKRDVSSELVQICSSRMKFQSRSNSNLHVSRGFVFLTSQRLTLCTL